MRMLAVPVSYLFYYEIIAHANDFLFYSLSNFILLIVHYHCLVICDCSNQLVLMLLFFSVFSFTLLFNVGELGWGIEGKQVGSMDEEPQVRGCYNITFICTPTNQETVSVLEKTQANKTFRT